MHADVSLVLTLGGLNRSDRPMKQSDFDKRTHRFPRRDGLFRGK